MITDAVLDLLQSLAEALFGWIGSAFEPPNMSGFSAMVDKVVATSSYAANFLPIGFAAVAVGGVLTAHLAALGVRAVLWVATKAHLLGGE